MIKRVCAAYWSATGTTEIIVKTIAREVSKRLGTPLSVFDFTLPDARQNALVFDKEDFVIFGTPTYAGRVPNVLLPYLDTVRGEQTLAVPVVTFGNRAFDDSLIELRDILLDHGFLPFAAAAFVGEHSFSSVLAAGRPDSSDVARAVRFAELLTERLPEIHADTPPVIVSGRDKADRKYYQPRDRAGRAIDIRKVKPKVNERCDDCGLCARVCPMGSISPENIREYIGICIKCGACIKKCPSGARYYDDENYLYHKTELEEGYKRRAENVWFGV